MKAEVSILASTRKEKEYSWEELLSTPGLYKCITLRNEINSRILVIDNSFNDLHLCIYMLIKVLLNQ